MATLAAVSCNLLFRDLVYEQCFASQALTTRSQLANTDATLATLRAGASTNQESAVTEDLTAAPLATDLAIWLCIRGIPVLQPSADTARNCRTLTAVNSADDQVNPPELLELE